MSSTSFDALLAAFDGSSGTFDKGDGKPKGKVGAREWRFLQEGIDRDALEDADDSWRARVLMHLLFKEHAGQVYARQRNIHMHRAQSTTEERLSMCAICFGFVVKDKNNGADIFVGLQGQSDIASAERYFVERLAGPNAEITLQTKWVGTMFFSLDNYSSDFQGDPPIEKINEILRRGYSQLQVIDLDSRAPHPSMKETWMSTTPPVQVTSERDRRSACQAIRVPSTGERGRRQVAMF